MFASSSSVFLNLLIDLKMIFDFITAQINICPKYVFTLPCPIEGLINPNVDLQFFVHLITCPNASSPIDIHRLLYHHYAHFQNPRREENCTSFRKTFPEKRRRNTCTDFPINCSLVARLLTFRNLGSTFKESVDTASTIYKILFLYLFIVDTWKRLLRKNFDSKGAPVELPGWLLPVLEISISRLDGWRKTPLLLQSQDGWCRPNIASWANERPELA